MGYTKKLVLHFMLLAFSVAIYADDIQPIKEPVLIGLDGEFGYIGSTSAEAIRVGIQVAIDEINLAGGVLDGRPLKLVEKANHSVPARSIKNIKEFAKYPDLVAIFCGRFSPTVLEALPTLQAAKIPLLDPWAATDAIIDNGSRPNYAFRLSLSDGWAMPTMIRYAESKGAKQLGLLLLNTSWGRGNLISAESYVSKHPSLKIVDKHWFNWNDKSFSEKYEAMLQAGAEAVLMIANADEAAILIKEMANLPPEQHLPIIAHWGVTGGRLPEMSGPALHQVDFSVVQTYSFIHATRPKVKSVTEAAQQLFNVSTPRQLPSPTGIAHAYDLTHILAMAINLAGTTQRSAVRDALEQVKDYDGLIKFYKRPFSPENHDALSPDDVFMAEYDKHDNAIVRVWPLTVKE